MFKALVFASVLVPTLAYADDWIFKVNDQEVVLLGKSLGMMPYNDVKALVDKLNQQIAQQQAERAKVQPPNNGASK